MKTRQTRFRNKFMYWTLFYHRQKVPNKKSKYVILLGQNWVYVGSLLLRTTKINLHESWLWFRLSWSLLFVASTWVPSVNNWLKIEKYCKGVASHYLFYLEILNLITGVINKRSENNYQSAGLWQGLTGSVIGPRTKVKYKSWLKIHSWAVCKCCLSGA